MLSLRVVLAFCLASSAMAQIPSFGWCPDYAAMPDFDMGKYLGVWYEAERYFTVLEVASRCVTTNYTQGLDGKFHVSNQITNRLTRIKRIVDGELRSVGKVGEGKLTVKYSTLPVSFDTTFSVLETDYTSYSVMWSCSNLGPVNTQNAWVMTRERLAPGTVLQRAYGVLDKFKISRTFFVKTDQADCAILEANNSNDGSTAAEEEEEEEAEEAVRNVEPTIGDAGIADAVPLQTPSESMLPPAPLVAVVEETVKNASVEPAAETPVQEQVVSNIKAVPDLGKPSRLEAPLVPEIPVKLQTKSNNKKKVQA